MRIEDQVQGQFKENLICASGLGYSTADSCGIVSLRFKTRSLVSRNSCDINARPPDLGRLRST